MSWLSHFTGWVGEKKNTILPIVTGLVGFTAGMIPGIGGAVSKQIDKWGSKLSGLTDGFTESPASPGSPAVSNVSTPAAPTTAAPHDLGNAAGTRHTPPAETSKTPLYIGLGVLGLLLFSGKSR